MSLVHPETGEIIIETPGLLAGYTTPTGLNLPDGLDFDEWLAVGDILNHYEKGVQWWIGDWWAYGQHAYGDRAGHARASGRWAFQTFANAATVCRRIGTSRRREVLPFYHHEAVAALEPPEQDELLDLAETNGWTRRELRAEVRRRNGARKREEYLAERPGGGVVWAWDAYGWLTQQAGSADLLLTDPPYSTDVDDIAQFVGWWLPAALKRIHDAGRAYICIGAYPAELHAYLDAVHHMGRWRCEDVLVWTWRNTIGPDGTGYSPNWQAVLHIVGPDTPPPEFDGLVDRFSVFDISAPDGRHDGRLDPWQKPDALADRLLAHAGRPGKLIDPFAGTGTFIDAGVRASWTAWGSEIDADKLGLCAKRGIEVRGG